MSASVARLSAALTWFFVYWLQLTSAALTEQPHNTVVVEGQSTELYCQTTSRNTNNALLSWKFTSVDGADQKFINNDDGVNPEYSARNVSVLINDTTGYSRLIFTSTRLGDAGTYTCQDGGGVGEAKAAWIAVLDGEPDCNFTVTSDVTTVTCLVAVTASNIHKQLESLEVRPVVHPSSSSCMSGLSVNDTTPPNTTPPQSRQFTVVVNLTDGTSSADADPCPDLSLRFNATAAGNLVSAIDDRLPVFNVSLPRSAHRHPGSTTSPQTTNAAEVNERTRNSSVTEDLTTHLMPNSSVPDNVTGAVYDSGGVLSTASTQQRLMTLLFVLSSVFFALRRF